MILHTETIGSGEPLVILHTGLQTGKTDFQAQKAKFKQSYRVILPDLRGHGSSISNDLSNYFVDSAEDLKETLVELEIETAHIIGCSLGGSCRNIFRKKISVNG